MKIETILKNYPHLILYDGSCGMCQYAVRFFLKYNKNANFYFASLQSNLGEQIKKKFLLSSVDSIIYIENGKAHIYAKAVLKALKHTNYPVKFLHYLNIIPYFISNPVYKLIAKYRKRIVKPPVACPIYPPAIQKRFLDNLCVS